LFVSPQVLRAGEIIVRGDEHHYISRVRRARAGMHVELLDGAGRCAEAVIERLAADHTVLRAEAPIAVAAAVPRCQVLLPLIKGDRMDSCIEKLVEVGADTIVVWPAERSVVRLDGERQAARTVHYQAIAQAASRQSGRADVPTVQLASSLHDAIATVPDSSARVVLDPASALAAVPDGAGEVTFASGPEGGLAPGELEELAAAGFQSLSLGPRVLRADTAPVVAVAWLRCWTRS
jgi:16S rRNA (uracil1498-N3)-methyltransferase